MAEKILLVGSGPMAIEYAKVLQTMQAELVVIGRNSGSAEIFTKETNLPVATGGTNQWLKQNKEIPTKAIVVVTETELGVVTRELLDAGVNNILVEKPGGFDMEDIKQVGQKAQEKKAQVYVGYNRRFYSSVKKAQEIIKQDGGVLSFNFEFTEWGHLIPEAKKKSGLTKEWFLANSTHVVDLAFFLGGKPKVMTSLVSGSLDWHPSGSIYAGSGVSETKALFSYQANWESAGRWSVEILTKNQRLIFRPMEKLQSQALQTVAIEEIPLNNELDQKFKPGLYRQIEAWLGDKKDLPTIEEQVASLKYYEIIKNGGKLT